MAHVRTTLRDAAITAITGLTTTGSNVYSSRVFALSENKLPCWLVYTNNEDLEPGNMAGKQIRVIELVCEGVARTVNNNDDTLDLMLEELETALTLRDLPTAKSLDLVAVEVEFSDDGDAPFGSVTATFNVEVHTIAGAPGTSV